MTTAGVDPNLASNMQLLQKQSLKVEFHLDHTDYKKVENIGTGAYGVVCSAINKKTRQRVAIKKIPNLFTMDPRYAIRTYREIKILQHFKHGNIIAIREILQPANKDITDIYVVMDLMESDLHKIIYSKQTLTDEHVQYFLYQILRGLKYIHSAHVIHRDLKPSNLLVNADCELKIGDFGMARGMNFKAEKSNQMMTQYVATRWYRAPELIVAGWQGYGAAIDIWSVGCIFAEMLRRKHLFPGRDVLNQLAVIFGTLGIPSDKYLELLDSEKVCGFIRKITESDDSKPKTYAELVPKASAEAVDLLSKMLVIEPEKRINVEQALAHPFLAKYHDNNYEPNCPKIFDFEFEQELFNIQSDDQKRVKIQDLLRKEVLSYKKPKPIDFGALITSKSTEPMSSSSGDNPYADLNDFLAQFAAPDRTSNTPSVPSSNPLLAVKTAKPANLLLNQQKPTTVSNNPLLQSQKVNPLLAGAQSVKTNPLLNSQSNVPTPQNNSLLAQDKSTLPFQSSSTNSLLAGAVPLNPLLAGAAKSNSLLANNDRTTMSTTTLPQTLVVTSSESEHSNDTDLFTNFINKSGATQSKDETASLTVNTSVAKAGSDDIEMISAKLEQTDINNEKEVVSVEEEVENKEMGVRERIRNIINRKKSDNTSSANTEKPPGKNTITAYQRQKEREEKRKKRRLKEKTKKDTKHRSESTGSIITTEDQKMLDRWTAMAKPNQRIQPKPVGATNNVIVVYPAVGGHAFISSNVATGDPTTSGNTAIVNISTSQHNSNPQIHVSQVPQQQQQQQQPTLIQQQQLAQTSQHQLRQTGHHPVVIPGRHSLPQTSQRHQLPPQPMPQHPSHHHISHTQSMIQPQQVIRSQQLMQNIPSHAGHSNIPIGNYGNTFIQHRHPPPPQQQQRKPPAQTIRSFSDIAAMHGHSEHPVDHDTSLYDYHPLPPESNMYAPSTSTMGSVNSQHNQQRNDHYTQWNNNMNVNTTLDINRLVDHKQEESLPPMLVSTPKGTGGGYGVGLDMESMMAFNADMQNITMDSAPLSASLLADWMDVTSSMDPKALEDIQHELELSSALHDFPFSY